MLVGRNEAKLREIADRHGLTDWTTDLDAALARADVHDLLRRPGHPARGRRRSGRRSTAGKHIYTEKPTADDAARRRRAGPAADAAGVKHGVVQDKLFLPGLRKLKRLIDGGFFGRILSVRGEFGYWVFEGDWQPAQRPIVELPGRRRRRHRRSTCSRTGTTCWSSSSARSARSPRTSPRTSRAAWDEDGRALRGHRRRRRVRHLRARRRHRRADQLLLGGPGLPRRTGRVPGRRHRTAARSPGCATAGSSTAPPPRSRSGTRTCRSPRASAPVAGGAGQRGVRQRLQGAVGGVPAARRRGRAVPWDFWPAPAACSSPSSACGRRARAAASRSRSWPSERRASAGRRALRCSGAGAEFATPGRPFTGRVAYAAAHVVADPPAENVPGAPADARLGRHARVPPPPRGGTASASPRRWTPPSAAWAWTTRPTRELIRRSAAEARAVGGAIVAGVGTDQLPPGPATLDDGPQGLRGAARRRAGRRRDAGADGSRHLAAAARRPTTTSTSTATCSARPTARSCCTGSGQMFDPALAGYWGCTDLDARHRDRAGAHRRARRPRSTASRCPCSTPTARSRCAAACRPACASTPATTSTTPS